MYAIIMVSISDFCHEFQRKSNVPFEVKVSMPSNSRTNYTIQSHTHRHRHFVIHSLIPDIDPKMPNAHNLHTVLKVFGNCKITCAFEFFAYCVLASFSSSLLSSCWFSHCFVIVAVIWSTYMHIYSIHACIHWSHIEFNLCKFYSLMKTKKKNECMCCNIQCIRNTEVKRTEKETNQWKKKKISLSQRKRLFLPTQTELVTL